MVRTDLSVFAGVLLIALVTGCANFLESQAIAKFADAMKERDVQALRAGSTDDFQKRALRHPDAADDLKTLRLPKGKATVVRVKPGDDPNREDVIVLVGKRKKKMKYQLVRDPKTRKWLVNDAYVWQKRRGLTDGRWVTEQMDLLLTVREFLDAWSHGHRKQILATSTPQLRSVLQELSPRYLSRLSQRVVGKKAKSKKVRPEANFDDDVAIVSLARPTGKMFLTFRQIDGKWKVSDVAAESRSDKKHVNSLLKTATALVTATKFLQAFASRDKGTLSKICTRELFGESLAHANLSTISLVPDDASADDYEITIEGLRGNFVLRSPREVLQVSMVRTKKLNADSPTKYLVEDVTIYQLDRRQEVRISSLFTARERMLVFMEALARRDPAVLRKTASDEFNHRVWNRADAMFLHSALPPVFTAQAKVLGTSFSGPITNIQVRQNGRNLTYVLRNTAGEVRVDDVLLGDPGHPVSLKDRLELQLPIYRFLVGLKTGNIPLLQRTSSKDFNRLVWKQAKAVPHIGSLAPQYLQDPLSSVGRLGDQILVTLGNEHHGAKVLLNSESTHFVIDDVLLIAGRQPEQRKKLKHSLRTHFAELRSNAANIRHTTAHLNQSIPPTSHDATPAIPARFETVNRKNVNRKNMEDMEPDDSAFLDDPSPQRRTARPLPTKRLDQSGMPDFGTREPPRPRFEERDRIGARSLRRGDRIPPDPSAATAPAETERSGSSLRIIPNRRSSARHSHR